MSANDRKYRRTVRELSVLDVIRLNERRDRIVPDTLKGYEDKFSMMFLSWLKIYMETDFHEYYMMPRKMQRYLELEFKQFCDNDGYIGSTNEWNLQHKLFKYMIDNLGAIIQPSVKGGD